MTIAGKINALVIGITLTLGCLAVGMLGLQEYRTAQDQIVERASARVLSRPDLQLQVYYRENAKLRRFLKEFLTSPAISYAIIHQTEGEVLIRKDRPNIMSPAVPHIKVLRSGLTPLDRGQLVVESDLEPEQLEWLAAQLVGNRLTHLTLPIPTAINPNLPDLSRRDFAEAMANPDAIDSVHVIAYVHLGISHVGLLQQIAPFLTIVALTCLVIVGLCSLLTMRVTRQITAPLTRLARAADLVVSGELGEPLNVGGSGEVKEIAKTLNGLIGGMSTYKTKMDVDHQLLSMKVEERTSQLSLRNEELNQAVLEVTQTKDQLRQMAYYDSLTSLPNRRLFTEELKLLMRLAKRNKQTLALLFLDLDNFKRINDSLGHSAGDLLLREVGARLLSCVRESDVVAHYVDSSPRIDVSRLGGDEFTVVLNQIEQPEAAAHAAQRLIKALIQPMTIENHELVVTPSIGIALAPEDASDVEGLLRAADTAMYHAKASGKNNFLFYHSDMDAADAERLQLETDLRKAIERDELVLHYQPQINTAKGTVVGAEALIRWQHPERGLVPPFSFIPLAEEMGLIGELGDWVLREACRQMKEFEAEGLWLPKITVNVSALQFNPTFVRRVREVLLETRLAPSALCLELTEAVIVDDVSTATEALQDLKNLGVSLSIDDFGTGYSSLSYLSRFPLDELKIDRSFVIGFDKSENDASLVTAIIAMAGSMKLGLVAEGVETREQYEFLTSNGATVIQGFLFSKPVPAQELKPLLAEGYFRQQIKGFAEALA